MDYLALRMTVAGVDKLAERSRNRGRTEPVTRDLC
jgi:hypothetical protein